MVILELVNTYVSNIIYLTFLLFVFFFANLRVIIMAWHNKTKSNSNYNKKNIHDNPIKFGVLHVSSVEILISQLNTASYIRVGKNENLKEWKQS